MGTTAKIEQEWKPLCSDSMFVIPSDNPVVCMEHSKTKEHAYFDIKLDRFLSPQEAFDYLRGHRWSFA